jgi:hypothetical protein
MTSRRPEAVAWAVVGVLVAGWLALVQVFWLPLRVAGVPVPLSVLAAVTGNLLLPAAAARLSGSRVVGLLPALVWAVVVVAAMVRRPEGDLVLTAAGAVGTANLFFLLLGATAAAFSVGRLLGAGPARRPVRPGPLPPARDGAAPAAPAGSGSGGAR